MLRDPIPHRFRRALGPATLLALAIYGALLLAYLAVMPGDRLWSHSPYNHFTLQADAWIAGRLDLGGPPPVYTSDNDFARYDGKHYVSFPPVPALLMVPFRLAAGEIERVRDPMIFAWLAPLGPVLLFLALERLRESGRSPRDRREHAWLAMLLGLGTVYWFSAVQGSVWFAGHVVMMVCLCGYLLASVDARHPVLAGLLLALAFGTRPTAVLALPVFLFEAFRDPSGESQRAGWRRAVVFAAAAAPVVGLLMVHNALRFDDPLEFGHRYLAVRWRARIDEHGLFALHYLPRNLSVFLRGLPFVRPGGGVQINGHGLALWVTSPFYAWALWPRTRDGLYRALAASTAAMALTVLCYQNSGWVQFGYRFSNDFAPLLFVMLALAGRPFRKPFWLIAVVAVAINACGAISFDRDGFRGYYFVDPTQTILHAPD